MNKILTKDNYKLHTIRYITKLLILDAKKYFRKENIEIEEIRECLLDDSIHDAGMYRLCNLYGAMYMHGWYINRFSIRNRPIDGSEVKNRGKTLRGYTRFV